MKQLRDKYCAQGYVDTGDRATWRELYNDYVALGGNGTVKIAIKKVKELPLKWSKHLINDFIGCFLNLK